MLVRFLVFLPLESITIHSPKLQVSIFALLSFSKNKISFFFFRKSSWLEWRKGTTQNLPTWKIVSQRGFFMVRVLTFFFFERKLKKNFLEWKAENDSRYLVNACLKYYELLEHGVKKMKEENSIWEAASNLYSLFVVSKSKEIMINAYTDFSYSPYFASKSLTFAWRPTWKWSKDLQERALFPKKNKRFWAKKSVKKR